VNANDKVMIVSLAILISLFGGLGVGIYGAIANDTYVGVVGVVFAVLGLVGAQWYDPYKHDGVI
jgi:hypothetical protein